MNKRVQMIVLFGLIVTLSGCLATFYRYSDRIENYEVYVLYPNGHTNITSIALYHVNYTGWAANAVQIHANISFNNLNQTAWYNIEVSLDGNGSKPFYSYANSYEFTAHPNYMIDIALGGANGSLYIDLLHNYHENYPPDKFVAFTRLSQINFVFIGKLHLERDDL